MHDGTVHSLLASRGGRWAAMRPCGRTSASLRTASRISARSGGFEVSAADDHCLGLFATAIAMARPWVERITGKYKYRFEVSADCRRIGNLWIAPVDVADRDPIKDAERLAKKAKEAVEVLREELGPQEARWPQL
jgi:hypothetical protein